MDTESANLWAAGFQVLAPTQLALSGMDAATMTHVATAAYTDRNVPSFNASGRHLHALAGLCPSLCGRRW